MLVGSGFLARSREVQANRGGLEAGTTFYILDVENGAVHASRSVGNDNFAETVDNCAVAGNCMQLKNALQMDPVATGASDSRFITKAYIGDLDGNVWRFDLSTNGSGDGQISTATKLYAAGKANPLFASMATVSVGTQQYLFVGTGSDQLPSTGVNNAYSLLVLLDTGPSATKTAGDPARHHRQQRHRRKGHRLPGRRRRHRLLLDDVDQRRGAVHAVPATLYGFTFIGGPAYDTNGDGRITGATTTGKGKTRRRRRATASRWRRLPANGPRRRSSSTSTWCSAPATTCRCSAIRRTSTMAWDRSASASCRGVTSSSSHGPR